MNNELEGIAESTPETGQADEIKRPSVIKQIVPWVLTALIFYWIFKRVDFAKVWEQMQLANLWVLVPAMAGLVIVQVLLEVFTFGTSFKWFADRWPGYRQVAIGRVGPYPIQAVFAPLMAVVLLLYFVRVCKMRLGLIMASDGFTIGFDMQQGGISLIICVILLHLTGGEPLHWIIYMLFAFNLIFIPLWYVYWMTGVKDRLFLKMRDFILFHSWKVASWEQVGKMFCMRLPWFFATLGSMYACLWAFNIEVPLITFVIAAPLIMGVAFSPVSVGGYGGPQGMAILFFGEYAAPEIIVAQSLLWSTFFALFRILAGTIFVYPMIRNFQNPDKVLSPLSNNPVPEVATVSTGE